MFIVQSARLLPFDELMGGAMVLSSYAGLVSVGDFSIDILVRTGNDQRGFS
jgi:hypothetical protein